MESPSHLRRFAPGTHDDKSRGKCDALQRALDKVDASQKLLCLNQDGIGDSGVAAVADRLKTNAAISTVHLEHNSITCVGARILGALLTDNYYLTFLNLCNNAIADIGCEAIGAALATNHSLKQLKLAWNGIGPRGMAALCDSLQYNCSLQDLDLRWNQVTVEGAQALLTALNANDVLTDVNLRWNPISDEALAAVRALLRQDRHASRAQFLAERRAALQRRSSSEADGEAEQPSSLLHFPPLRVVSVETMTYEHDLGPTREEYQALEKELVDLRTQHEAAGAELEQLRTTVADLQQRLQEAQLRVQEKSMRLLDMEKATATLQTSSEQQLQRLEALLERERVDHSRLFAELQAHSREVEEQSRQEFQRLVADQQRALHASEALLRDELRMEQQERRLERQEHQQALAETQGKHTAELLKLQQTCTADVAAAKAQAHSDLQDARERHEAALAALRAHFEAIVEEKESEYRAKDFSFKQALEECEQLRRDTALEVQTLEHSHRLEVEQLKQHEVKLQHEMEVLRLQHSYALDESAKFITKLEEMEQLKKANEATLARQKEEQLADVLEDKKRRLLEHEVELRRRADEARALKEAHDLSLALLRDDHVQRLREAQADYEARLSRAVEAEGKKCDDLRRALRQLEEDLRAKHLEEQQQYVTTQLEAMRDAMLQRVAADKEELLRAHTEATDAFVASWQRWVQQHAKKGQGCACVIS